MPVFSVCSQVAWLLLLIGLGLLCIWASRGCSGLFLGGSPLGGILVDWGTCGHCAMSKEVLVYSFRLCGLCMFWIVGKGDPWMVS